MTNEEKDSGAELTGQTIPDVDGTLPRLQQIVDAVTESRRRYVGTKSINWCAYNDSRIRIAVIFPHPGGEWAIAGRFENPWANPHSPHEQPLKQFTLEAAKEDVHRRHPITPLTWTAEEVEQAGHEFAAVEKAS